MVPAPATESSFVSSMSSAGVLASAAQQPSISSEERARLERAFATYRRELSRLLHEGHAKRFALIVDDDVLSVWDTAGDAAQAGYERFGVDGKFCIHQLNPLDVGRFALLDAGMVRDLR